MIQTVEAVIDANGQVRLLGAVRVDAPRRALVTVLEEPAAVPGEGEAALLAGPAGSGQVVPGGEVVPRILAGSPRLAEPGRADDFRMDVAEEFPDARLR